MRGIKRTRRGALYGDGEERARRYSGKQPDTNLRRLMPVSLTVYAQASTGTGRRDRDQHAAIQTATARTEALQPVESLLLLRWVRVCTCDSFVQFHSQALVRSAE